MIVIQILLWMIHSPTSSINQSNHFKKLIYLFKCFFFLLPIIHVNKQTTMIPYLNFTLMTLTKYFCLRAQIKVMTHLICKAL
ncbi:hypothetical protein VIGAN_08270400 [Vigna angularis var. angularis]|uniref:Uncharacterized protein n=1 Tax=Vigna angularis var. angularis TaxID=157739 RepID=A0A0S3SSQ2_PHAAN|nr:hypothetical protein VIGAN_08270400 [Vigna angularis var. angularis]